MSSYRQIICQIIFGTKKHLLTIDEEHCEELYKYIWGIIKNKNSRLYRINGVENHIHILCDLHPSIALADYVKDIKVASSIWLKESGKFPKFESWQEGYAAFTYSFKEKDILIEYIKNQKQHHKRESFRDEYVRLLRENGVEFDEKYLM
jgi:putative transposase